MLDRRPAPHVIPRRVLWTWLGLLALSQAADLATTWASLSAGGVEVNPVVLTTLESGHFLLFAAVKTLLVAAMGIVLLGGRPVALAAARGLVLLFAAVALANLVSAIL